METLREIAQTRWVQMLVITCHGMFVFAYAMRSICAPGTRRRYLISSIGTTFRYPAFLMPILFMLRADDGQGVAFAVIDAALNILWQVLWERDKDDDDWWNDQRKKFKRWWRTARPRARVRVYA